MTSPYQRGYDEAIADVVTVVYLFWTFGKLDREKVLKSWPHSLKVVGWLLSGVALYLLFSYAVVPGLRIVVDTFGGN